MPSPTSALQRPDLGASMEEFDVIANRQGFIANRVAPMIDVSQQTANIGKIPLKALLVARETRRNPGGAYARGDYKFDTFSYATEEHGAEEVIDDRNARIFARYFDAEQIALKRAQGIILRNFEQRVAALLFNSTTWNGASLTTAVTDEWDDLGAAIPLDDVDAAVEKVFTGSGLVANALICNSKVFKNIMRCDQIISALKDNGIKDVAQMSTSAMADALAKLFFPEIPDGRVIIAGGVKNSANPNATATPARIWDPEYAMVARVANSNDPQEPCVARTFHYTGDGSALDGAVETYREEKVRGDVLRVRHETDELVMYTAAAHLLSNVSTI